MPGIGVLGFSLNGRKLESEGRGVTEYVVLTFTTWLNIAPIFLPVNADLCHFMPFQAPNNPFVWSKI